MFVGNLNVFAVCLYVIKTYMLYSAETRRSMYPKHIVLQCRTILDIIHEIILHL